MYKIFEKLMESQGATHYRVAKESGVDQATLSRWKNEKGEPSLETLQILADYFGVTLDYMRGRENNSQGEQKESPPSISDEELMGLNIAFYGEAKQSLSDGDKDDIRALIEAKLKRNKEQGK